MPEAPRMYDVSIDETRPMTQVDADRWANHQQAMGCFIRGQDILRAALHDVAIQKMEWGTFMKAINAFEKELGFRHIPYIRDER